MSVSRAISLDHSLFVWQDNQGKVWLSYNSPEYLKERYGFPEDLLPNISAVEALTTKAGEPDLLAGV